MKCDKCKHAENCPAKAEHGGAKRCSAFKPKLKPCPFCGGEAKVGRIFGHETVFCTECDACILPSPYNSFANTDKELDESIKMWNARVVAE